MCITKTSDVWQISLPSMYLSITFRCATSREVVFPDFDLEGSLSYRCQGDDGFYQLCGLGLWGHELFGYTVGLDGSIALCGHRLCEESPDLWRVCSPPKQEEITCDNSCDDKDYCEDEAYCNGVQYGIYCVPRDEDKLRYLDPSKVFLISDVFVL